MWTSAPVADLLPGLRRIADTLPPEPSHAMWMNWGPSPERPDMAYSLEDDIYIALYASWTDAADDERYASWPGDRMREMEHLATGIQLADENLAERPARFISGREHAAARRDPRPLRPRRPLPLLDDKRLAAETHTLSRESPQYHRQYFQDTAAGTRSG